MTKELLQRAYELGFLRCARWAKRDDLLSDTGSMAYTIDCARDLAAIAQPEQPIQRNLTSSEQNVLHKALIKSGKVIAATSAKPAGLHICTRHDNDIVNDPEKGCPKCNAERLEGDAKDVLNQAAIGLAALLEGQSNPVKPTIHEYGQASRALNAVRAAIASQKDTNE